MRAAVVELSALVARQAAAILRLLTHLANPGGGAAPTAIAAGAPGSTPAPAPQPPPPMMEIAAIAPLQSRLCGESIFAQ